MGANQTDLELVRRVQSGDKAAFDILVLKYQQKVINLVTRYVHDPHIAMDVSQESFIKAYKGLKNFRGDSAFYTWLYRISINTAKNHLVSKSRRMPDDDIDAQEAEQYDGGGKLRDISTPENQMMTDEIKNTLNKAIEALPDDLRIAITLRELEGLSYEEISDAMDCPIGTVRSRIFRARESIESELEPLIGKI
ncbi:RNA polymerase sigma factor RpoE [Cocleimonas flava]|jgi:RNA polymerase sigma-70 factor (ECF subfamily)|uniref:RNA polymerase RpoE-like sigma-24 subunit n=1 Tax=Cocleimonas flava TaxID=634765 RepID=A0A4R1EVM3_9GAMM|nr:MULTISPECIES: RNA polymerase sigma factor RpoE [Cocleimonas]MEB8433902.1 RNA polymerase sigma factor RpoE [Cocleimonas sp. KMM 6892]MEC4716713.1 RNA polymerase sigma factor RpoE [Cocleimonas sp. KMM 6895]MEC4746132.1 RNA polymerase sigma factor RpoE [Cocleimonas sp. KMM 6896]TCJ84770.1 RNA polymerase RpoE-like sigma-24 subunit [Cocleimonas flava]